ncbi:STAS-like domain-containing protein [Candidatus Woesearchaeota archaeon]|nr:STAS-like domain-containing protein [Candidatus Woesearchaeota archaeon]
MIEIKIYKKIGNFAGNKDIAKEIRTKEILPFIRKEDKIFLDFENVNSATQSFIHALISDVIRKEGIKVLDKLFFKNCNETIQKIIGIVVEYMQDTGKKD